MDNKELQEKWPEIKEKIKEKYPALSDHDLMLEIGKEADLLLRLQQKLGKNDKDIRDWLSIMG